jgi:hypothetical protein
MMLVSVDEALAHLRIDEPVVDFYNDLELKIQGASRAIIRYLKDQADEVIEYDSDGDVVAVDEDVKIACLVFVAELWKNREGDQGGEIDPRFGYGYLPRPVLALLTPLRDPTVA